MVVISFQLNILGSRLPTSDSFQIHGMISEIAEHSVDLDLLPEKANVLDLGCRGFLFTNEMRWRNHLVWPVDIDELPSSKAYYQVAITDRDGRCGIERTADKQATRIKVGDAIPCYTLHTFMGACDVKIFDLIKMDVEGSEYEIIMSQKKAPCRQWSIEFHLHTGIYTQKHMMEMEDKLRNLGYEFTQHELTERYGAGFNYWDSLFLLR